MKSVVMLLVTLLSSLTANATFIDRGNGMIYDSEQNLTWLQDFSYALISNPDAGTYHAEFSAASSWVSALNFGGYSDWRLPSANLIGDYGTNGESYTVWSARIQALYGQQSFDGSTDRGFNNYRGELGHLFSELGNLSAYDELGTPQAGAGLLNTGPFINMLSTRYYEGDPFFHFSGEAYVWAFDLSNGYHTGVSQYLEYPTSPMWIAVHDGDIGRKGDDEDDAVKVPEPSSVMLIGIGLIGLLISRRRVLQRVE